MGFMKRIFLFLAVNVLITLTISLALRVLGVEPYLTSRGIDYGNLLAFCLVWGMGGAFISLLLSKFMAKHLMGVQLVDPETRDPELQNLVQMVSHLARAAGLPKMPEVGVYDSPEVNAFATGPSRSNSLVAVSTGLMDRMNRDEMEGVLGHEISHIANGDMVTMTLLQGVVNAFVMFLARALAFVIAQSMRGRDDDNRSGASNYMLISVLSFVFEIVFMILGTIVVAWFSRFREFRADQGGARVAGRDKMIAALEKLRRTYEIEDPVQASKSLHALKISTHKGSFLRLFSTHPPLEERIARLETLTHL